MNVKKGNDEAAAELSLSADAIKYLQSSRKTFRQNLQERFTRENRTRYFKSLKYSLYLCIHPLDGLWDLTHERKGSIAAANTIIVLMLLVRLWKMQFTNFMFLMVRWQNVNIIKEFLGVLAPIAIGCIANWSLTTLFDGKGTLKNIYMAVGYCMTPYVIIQLPMIFLSNMLTLEEGAIWSYLNTFTMIWIGLLLFAAMMEIHDYSLGKAVFASVATIAGMLIIIFIMLLFFSLITDGIGYFVSIYKELVFRIY
jgi:hypothetical protein